MHPQGKYFTPATHTLSMEAMEIKSEGYSVIEKTAAKHGKGAHVYVPLEWLGRRVRVILLEPAPGAA